MLYVKIKIQIISNKILFKYASEETTKHKNRGIIWGILVYIKNKYVINQYVILII
jgi:hypothetical protein